MTEQNPTPPAPPAAPTEPAPTPAPVSTDDKPAVRYAAYDKTYERYVGGTHDTAAKARKAAKDKGSTDIQVREV